MIQNRSTDQSDFLCFSGSLIQDVTDCFYRIDTGGSQDKPRSTETAAMGTAFEYFHQVAVLLLYQRSVIYPSIRTETTVYSAPVSTTEVINPYPHYTDHATDQVMMYLTKCKSTLYY